MWINKNRNQISALLILLATGMFSCNREYPNLLEHVGNDSINVVGNEPKVLYIMLTGATGQATQEANTPNLTQMAKHAIYTFDGIADYEQAYDTFSVVNGWANMLTGVTQSKSNTDTIWSENNLDAYPTFISRMKNIQPDWKTSAFVSSDELKNKFLSGAGVATSFSGNDDATVQATIDALQDEEDLKIVVTQLSGIEQAGEQYGYADTITQYMSAIQKADGQVGELLDALKNRENYSREKWLVVVASGKGGGQMVPALPTPIAYNDMLRNTFIMFYNPLFQSYYVPKPRNTSGAGPFKGKTIRLWGDPDAGDGINAVVDTPDDDIYNPGDGAMTIEAKVKFAADNNSSNAPFLGKGERYGSNPGWILRTNGNHSVTAYAADGSKHLSISSSTDLFDGDWHTLALAIWKVGSTVNMVLFIDNVKIGTTHDAFSAGAKIGTTRNLQFGYNPYVWGEDNKVYIADVRIWDVRLPDDIIKEYSCFPGMVPPTHPFINDLIGLWPCTDGEGTVFKDLVKGNDAALNPQGSATIKWEPFNDVSDNICPAPASAYYRMVPNSVDIPFEIYQWLGVNISAGWQLDGKGWVTGYTDVTNPIQ